MYFIRTGNYLVRWFINGDSRSQEFETKIVECNSFAEAERDFLNLPHITEHVIIRTITAEICEENDW